MTNLHLLFLIMAYLELTLTSRYNSTNDDIPEYKVWLLWFKPEDAKRMDKLTDGVNIFKHVKVHKRLMAIVSIQCQNAIGLYKQFKLNYACLRNEVNGETWCLLEKLLYLNATKMVKEAIGVTMNREWFEDVFTELIVGLNFYVPKEEILSWVSYNRFSDELNDRINAGMFEPTDEEREKLAVLTDDLDATLKDMLEFTYGVVYTHAKRFFDEE